MTAVLENKKVLVPGTREFTFVLPDRIEFKPGQYVFVTLPKLDKPDERGPRRHFSITNSPKVDNRVIIATRIRDSGFKQTLTSLPIGSNVEIRGPYGEFFIPEDKNNLVFIAGGIGITPFMSMLASMQDLKKSYDKVLLFYSNTSRDRSAYLEELMDYEKKLPFFKLVATMTDDKEWEGEKGRINSDMIHKYVNDIAIPQYFIVGPESMNQGVNDLLLEIGVPENNIMREDFTGY